MTHRLVLVITTIKYLMATAWKLKSLHVFHASHIVLSSEATGAYHHNFALNVIFCVLMVSCITNHTKCEHPTSISSP